MASSIAPVKTVEKKYYDKASGMYVIETKQYYTSPPWPVKTPELTTYNLSFSVALEACGEDSMGRDHIDAVDPDTFYLFGDEEEEERKEKEALKTKYEKRQADLRGYFQEHMEELNDIDETWKAQWLLYTMQDLNERIKLGEKEYGILEGPIPLENISISFDSIDTTNMTATGTLTWTSLKAPLKMVQEDIDWRLGDRMRYYGFENRDHYSFEFIPEEVSYA